jgi:hypothetical protein
VGYATIQDAIDFGLNAGALGLNVTPAQLQRALDVRSAYADGKMRARYGYENVPLPPPYDPAIVQAVVHLATYDLLVLRGFDPSNGSDAAAFERFKAAIKYFDDIERQTAHPNVSVAQSSSAASAPIAQPLIQSIPQMGWIPDPNNTASPFDSGVD